MIHGKGGIRASEVVVGTATDMGHLRTTSRDGYLAIAPTFVVVDGVGGHVAGRMAVQVVPDSPYSLAGATITDVDMMVRAVVAAQKVIIAVPPRATYLPGTTTTDVILIWILDGRGVARLVWVIFNIGGARVYLLCGDMLSQVTRDHSRVQILIKTGELTPERARRDPHRNIVTRALGGDIIDSGVPDPCSVPVAAGDRPLIYSDGFSGGLGDEAIATVLAAGYTAQRMAKLLVAASLGGGEHDNTTAVAVDTLQVPNFPLTAHPSRPGGASSQGAQ